MNQAQLDLRPADWQITVTTVYCDAVGSFVSLMVRKDWTANCAWHERHHGRAGEGGKRGAGRGEASTSGGCAGPDCALVGEYRAKLMREDAPAETRAESTTAGRNG